jgi:hypothetical protein
MSLRILEERCRRFIELMQQGSAAIDRRDGAALSAVSVASEELFQQIERGWLLVVSNAERPDEYEEWARLRALIAEAAIRSQQNQAKLTGWMETAVARAPAAPLQGNA